MTPARSTAPSGLPSRPYPGLIVHFVLSAAQCRPAIIVRVWPDPATGSPDPRVALAVFIDGPRDVDPAAGLTAPLIWQSAVPYDPTAKERTWHTLTDHTP